MNLFCFVGFSHKWKEKIPLFTFDLKVLEKLSVFRFREEFFDRQFHTKIPNEGGARYCVILFCEQERCCWEKRAQNEARN